MITSKNSKVEFSGDVNITNNVMRKGFFDVKSLVQKEGNIKLNNNKVRRGDTGDVSFIRVSSESYISGNIEAKDNKIIQASSINNRGRVAILNVASPGPTHSITAGDLWKHIYSVVKNDLTEVSQSVMEKMLERGTLSSALYKALGDNPSRKAFVTEYKKLADCLAHNRLYGV